MKNKILFSLLVCLPACFILCQELFFGDFWLFFVVVVNFNLKNFRVYEGNYGVVSSGERSCFFAGTGNSYCERWMALKEAKIKFKLFVCSCHKRKPRSNTMYGDKD